MSNADSFLHITHRTVAWFRKAAEGEGLVLAAPFQRNAVWTIKQKAYFIDTILNGLPIPELYMQDVGYADGSESHIVIDGQQRIRAALGFVNGEFALEGEDVAEKWRGKRFDDLTEAQRRDVFAYKFVVRILPPAPESEVRAIFSRLNRNTVALNEQEIRNSTYWGAFIQCVQGLAEDPFWAESGIFTADDHRRMRDHEFISELVAAWLGGAQNKKDGLDRMYAEYERKFPQRKEVEKLFRATTAQIAAMIPDLRGTRWRKKSDFYTLFLALLRRAKQFPLSERDSAVLAGRILGFADAVDDTLKLAEAEGRPVDPRVADYARAVVRATSDKSSRVARLIALEGYVFQPWAAAQAQAAE
jgi:hypothetical protein